MKNKICFLYVLSLLFLPVVFAAAPPQPAPAGGYISIGGHNSTSVIVPPLVVTPERNPLGWFVLQNNGNPTSNNVTPYRKNGVAYQVTAGKTATCIGAFGQTSAANSPWQLFYADAAFAHDATAASLTNPVYQNGSATVYTSVWYSLAPSQMSFFFEIPANKYAGVQISTPSVTSVYAVCRER